MTIYINMLCIHHHYRYLLLTIIADYSNKFNLNSKMKTHFVHMLHLQREEKNVFSQRQEHKL